jgi:ferritin-like metal-binding protein YciE
MGDTIQDRLTAYLTDAHSIEEQALAQLRSIPDMDAPKLTAALHEHLPETEGHERAVKQLLEGRDAGPSWFKDAVMKLGGKGFVLFAKLNPDTPGKLLAHALSYEALEEASYSLLAIVAGEAGETDVVREADRIRAEEIGMEDRLSDCFDECVEASLKAVGRDDLSEQLARYLADAHAIEQQAIGLLERGADRLSGPLADAFQHHLVETQDQAESVAARLDALGRDPSTLKDSLMRAGAFNWATFFQAHPDTPGKLAGFAYAFEHLEIGGYEQLKRVAVRAGDTETAQLAERILDQERTAATTLKGLFPDAVQLALAETGRATRQT